jgi:transposase-like protein
VRWSLQFPVSYRDLERMLADRGVAVDHTTMYRWVQRFAPDHRRVKRRTGPMLGFESFRTARRTLAGVEAMAMLAKGQVRAVPANDLPAQRGFVHRIFGLAA